MASSYSNIFSLLYYYREQLKDPEVEPTTDWTPQAEDAENQDPK